MAVVERLVNDDHIVAGAVVFGNFVKAHNAQIGVAVAHFAYHVGGTLEPDFQRGNLGDGGNVLAGINFVHGQAAIAQKLKGLVLHAAFAGQGQPDRGSWIVDFWLVVWH